MDSEWAKNLAARKKSELEAKRLQQEKDLNDRKLLDTNADKMWVEVRRAAAPAAKNSTPRWEATTSSSKAPPTTTASR